MSTFSTSWDNGVTTWDDGTDWDDLLPIAEHLFCSSDVQQQKYLRTQVPASLYTGRYRLFVQAVYGAQRDDLAYIDGDDIAIGSISSGHWWGSDTGLYKDDGGDFWVVYLSGRSTLSIQKLKHTSCLSSQLKNKAAVESGDQAKWEAYYLGYCEANGEAVSLTLTDNSSPANGSPPAYGWKFNWQGNLASVVLWSTDAPTNPYERITYLIKFTLTDNDTLVESDYASYAAYIQARFSGTITLEETSDNFGFQGEDRFWAPAIDDSAMLIKGHSCYPYYSLAGTAILYCWYDSEDELVTVTYTNDGTGVSHPSGWVTLDGQWWDVGAKVKCGCAKACAEFHSSSHTVRTSGFSIEHSAGIVDCSGSYTSDGKIKQAGWTENVSTAASCIYTSYAGQVCPGFSGLSCAALGCTTAGLAYMARITSGEYHVYYANLPAGAFMEHIICISSWNAEGVFAVKLEGENYSNINIIDFYYAPGTQTRCELGHGCDDRIGGRPWCVPYHGCDYVTYDTDNYAGPLSSTNHANQDYLSFQRNVWFVGKNDITELEALAETHATSEFPLDCYDVPNEIFVGGDFDIYDAFGEYYCFMESPICIDPSGCPTWYMFESVSGNLHGMATPSGSEVLYTGYDEWHNGVAFCGWD